MEKFVVNKQEKEVVETALRHWQEQGSLSEDQASLLRASLEERSFEWRVLARYAFWVALLSLVFAVFSLLADETLTRFVEQFYNTPSSIYCIFFVLLAIFFYSLGFRQQKKSPQKRFSSETLMLAGSCATAASIGFLGDVMDRESQHYTFLFLLSILVYGFLSVRFKSTLIWIFTLVALGIWFATETAYHSDWGFRFWGMNYPLRFTLFGLLLTSFACFAQPRIASLAEFKSTSYTIGLLYTMIALWCLSIFGNYSSFDAWSQVRQYEILYWGIIAILLCLALGIYGLKKKDNVSRDIGFVFFLLNLYTRFVEYLWDNMNRAIFFLLLALSFWLVGRWAEKIWNTKAK